MWVQTISLKRLQREQRYIFQPETGEEILICWINEQVYAFSALCPHHLFSLEKGFIDLEEFSIQCPLHQWRFDLESGKGLNQESCLHTYPTQIKAGKIQIKCPPNP